MTDMRPTIPRSGIPFAVAAAMLVAACAMPGSKRAPAPVEDRATTPATAAGRPAAVSEEETRPGEFQPLPAGDEQAPPQTAEPAVIALLDESDQKLRGGQPEEAAAAVERALRISPGNALLWHRLAAIRVEQGRWSQAEALAQKSLSLGGDDQRLQSDNWKLIARSRKELGDAAGARAAENAAARAGSAAD